jgi:tetratricopeptide (TPR) repeat protein
MNAKKISCRVLPCADALAAFLISVPLISQAQLADPLDAWEWLAKAYQKQGDKPKARDALQRALQLNPQGASAKETSLSIEK